MFDRAHTLTVQCGGHCTESDRNLRKCVLGKNKGYGLCASSRPAQLNIVQNKQVIKWQLLFKSIYYSLIACDA